MNSRKRKGILERGDLKVLILNQLKKPTHSYGIIARLKEESSGEYKPSTGALYPQLQSLEENGLVKRSEADGRKIYALTKRGEEYLSKNQLIVNEAMGRFVWAVNCSDLKELRSIMDSMAEVWTNGLKEHLKSKDYSCAEKIRRTKELFSRTEKELEEIWR